MRFQTLPALSASLFALAAWMPAQEALKPLNSPAPLMLKVGAAGSGGPAGASAGQAAVTLAAAQRAQALGLPSVAAGLYRQLLAAPAKVELDRSGLTLALVTTLLDDARPAEAAQELDAWRGPRGSAWHLRAGLAAAQSKKIELARQEAAATKAEELSADDRAWFSFLQGALFDLGTVQDITRANEFYVKAESAATTELARARFQLAAEEVRLRLAAPSQAQIDATKRSYDQFQGRAPGYDFARSYAVMLDMSGRKAEALKFLQVVMLTLPPSEALEVG
jgi:tetratricopeptide (TPR) repeat protein